MVAKKAVRLGEEAFVLSSDGDVVRTVVARLDENGYLLLDGSADHHPHWFSFPEAVSAANARISTRQKALRKQLRALAGKRRALEGRDYWDGVMNAPFRVVDLRDEASLAFTRRRHTRGLKKIRVPETYLEPGHMVYVIITPATRSSWAGEYRPHKHYVLETEVKSVCFSPDGQAHYTFSTLFIVEEFFPSREEAAAKLGGHADPRTEEVPFVPSKMEKEENAKLLDDDIPF